MARIGTGFGIKPEFGKRKIRKCVITLTPDSTDKHMDVVGSNDFSIVEMFDMMDSLNKHFAKICIDNYILETGDKLVNEKLLDNWLAKKRKLL